MAIHVGGEMGGTSCKVGVFDEHLKQVDSKIFKTLTPTETLTQMSDYINSKGNKIDSIGIAAFGPLCLDPSSDEYGNITTTPKPNWANTPVLKHFKEKCSPDKVSLRMNLVAITYVKVYTMLNTY